MLKVALFEELAWYQGNDVLGRVEKSQSMPPMPGMCTSCYNSSLERSDTALEEVWSLLPRWVEL